MNTGFADLAQLAAAVRDCRRCPLAGLRTLAVPGEGPTQAEILLIGEGPGQQEDRQGRPFVGASGHLLQKLLAGVGLDRSQVFITNVVKRRPPNNRDPLPVELAACAPFLDDQVTLIDPLILITLGRFSLAHFLGPGARITQVHGRPTRLGDRLLLPMFHPAAALRNLQWQQALEADFAQLPGLLAAARRSRPPRPDNFTQLSLF